MCVSVSVRLCVTVTVNVNVTVTVLVCLIGFLSVQHSRFCFSRWGAIFTFAAVFFNVQLQTGCVLALRKVLTDVVEILSASPGFSKDLRTWLFQLETPTPLFPTSTLSASLYLRLRHQQRGGMTTGNGSECRTFGTCVLFCWHFALEVRRRRSGKGRSKAKRTRATNATTKGTSTKIFEMNQRLFKI